MSDFWTDIERKARKAHRCIECRRTIQPGETYTKSAGVWEGDFQSCKRCAHCMAYMRIIRRMDADALWESNLRDWVGEYGLVPGELLAYPDPLTWLRWGTWFDHRWTDVHGNLRDIPHLCASDTHKPVRPASVHGSFASPYNPANNDADVWYCATCADFGTGVGMFTPDPAA